MKAKKILYHYTTMQSLMSILESNTLRFSSCRNYKDKNAETNALKAVLEKNIDINYDFKKSIINFIINILKVDLKGIDQNNHNELVKRVISIRDDSYMVCFSQNYTNDHLWKKHATNNNGVVIGFNMDYLTQEHFPTSISGTSWGSEGRAAEVRLTRMMYEENEFISEVCGWNTKNTTIVFAVDAYKSAEYEKEKEERLLVYLPESSKKFHLINNSLSSIHIDKGENESRIVRNFQFKRYLELQLLPSFYKKTPENSGSLYYPPGDYSHPIEEIYCKNDKTYKLVQDLLERENLKNEVRLELINNIK